MNESSNGHKNVFRFLSYVKPYKWALILSTVIGVIKYNLPVLFPWILKDVIDNLLAGKPSQTGLTFNELMLATVGLFVLYSVITYFRTYIADRLAQVIMFDLRKQLFGHLQRLPMDFFHKNQTGAISSRLITDVSNAQSLVNLAGTNLFMDLTSVASITFVVFYMDWKLALVAYSMLPLYAFIQKRVSNEMHVKAKEARRRMEVLEGGVHETVSGIPEIKTFTGEKEETRRFLMRCRHYLEAMFDSIRTYAFLMGSTALVTRLAPVVVIWVGGHFVLKEQLTVGALMAFYAYLQMIYDPLIRLSELNIQIANSRAAIDRLFEFFDFAPEKENTSCPPLRVRTGEIEYRGVVFGYGDNHPIFRGIHLHIPAGRRVAFVGPSGAGKSTLVKLLIRFFDPWRGEITIDGQEIRAVNLQSLRSQISVVQQDLMLFSGTVEDNIRVGRGDCSADEIRRAAEFANATSIIEKLPHGFQTEVGERGVRLSGGQKQLIAISRAFLKNAPILILDESTSSLDSPTERLVYDALERLMKNRTTIMIAHRISTVLQSEMIVVLDRGKIVQQGTHDELLKFQEGLYFNLFSDGFRPRAARKIRGGFYEDLHPGKSWS